MSDAKTRDPKTWIGRPPGAKNIAPMGVKRLTAALRRMPADASPEQRQLAAKAKRALDGVLAGGWNQRHASTLLQAISLALEEACGPHRQSSSVELSGMVSLSALVPRVGDRPKVLAAAAQVHVPESVGELVPVRRPSAASAASAADQPVAQPTGASAGLTSAEMDAFDR